MTTRRKRRARPALPFQIVPLAALLLGPRSAAAEESAQSRPAAHEIRRAAGPIAVDGDLSDAGWAGAARVETWYETNPGDNVPPKVKNVAYLTYDDRYFYVGFDFEDPDPKKIRAPLGDRDNLPGYTDYAGVILDTRNDGRTGAMFLASPRGIQYDAISDDASGNEDSSPDFFWDAAGRITATGWTLEIRIPFSSLRYPHETGPQTWGILLYRNWPREYRYQMFSARLPRGGNCFVCFSSKLKGLENLPSSGHLVAAPYVSAMQESVPRGELGSDLVTPAAHLDGGLDVKWNPNAVTAVDGTLNPDFSQVESDAAQITANERFALFYPEKRPFFLEGVELFSTPINAVYTRTITAPKWGLRATGKFDKTAYTALVAEDRGGGSVILPGANDSGFGDQDFKSTVALARLRHDLGKSFVSFLATDREVRGGGYNRVFGPDFQWLIGDRDKITGQLLLSSTRTPNRPELAAEWDGRTLSGHAASVWYSHSSPTWDWFAELQDFDGDFRADQGFVPQVGFREVYAEIGRTFRPTGLLNRVRTFLETDYTEEREEGGVLFRHVGPGVGMNGLWNSFGRFQLNLDKVRAGDRVFSRTNANLIAEVSPSSVLSRVELQATLGEEIDFANVRRGTGTRLFTFVNVRPTDHVDLRLTAERQTLDVKPGGAAAEGRLFTALVARLKATYTFSARSFLRLIGQYTSVTRDPGLYTFEVGRKDAGFSTSALFAYKLNWQTVLFLGLDDRRVLLDEERGYAVAGRQAFLKLSYAFQR